MKLFSQNMKFCISCNDHKNISHNIIEGHLFLTMSATKKLNPHRIQWLTTNAMCVTTLTLGSWLRQGAWKGEGQECNLGITFTLSGMRKNVREWTHTFPSGLSLWELEFWRNFKSSKSNLKGLIGLKISLYHWKSLEIYMSKMGLYGPFEYLQHKLWLKEGPEVKVSVWLLTTKS